MDKNENKCFSSSQKTASTTEAIEGAVERIIGGFRLDLATDLAQQCSREILMAAADLILAAGTGLLSPACVAAVSPTEVVESITPFLSGESVEEHLRAFCLLQYHVAELERSRRLARELKAWLAPFDVRESRKTNHSSLTSLLSSEVLAAYTAWLRQRRALFANTK